MSLKPLLNLFNSNPDIHSISFSNLGWEEKLINENEISWTSPDYPAWLSINYFNKKPDLPCAITEIDAIRSFYRKMLLDENGGILKVEAIRIEETDCLETLFKVPRHPSGFLYVSSITIPFHNCSYVIKLQITEKDMSGIREAVVGQKLLAENMAAVENNNITGWSSDPYLSEHHGGSLMNIAEREEYDDMFPEHPLSLIRKHMKTITESIRFSKKLKRVPKF